MWFDTKVCTVLLWIWVVSRALVDYTETRRVIGCLIDTVHTPYVPGTVSNGKITACVYKSLTIHPGSNNHVWMFNLVHRKREAEKFH